MFEVAELGHRVDKQSFNAALPALRLALLKAQQQLRQAQFPVIVLVSGVDGAGKGDTINLLNEWMDPRYLRAFAFDTPTDEERERPPWWTFWRSLPANGTIGLYVGSWYSEPIARRVYATTDDDELYSALQRIKAFEKALTDDGALIVKFWLHLSKAAQKQRLKALRKDPRTAWRVTRQDRRHLKLYERFRTVAEQTLRETSTGNAPWIVVDGSDPRYRRLTIGQQLLRRLEERLRDTARNDAGVSVLPHSVPQPAAPRRLDTLDLTHALAKPEYKRQLRRYQEKLGKLSRAAGKRGISSLLLLEGWDAAGKGGIIRRLVPAMDARHYQVIPIAAPSDEERAHHYLWRFWRHIPRAGKVTIYDRSWYGRVLVERVEGFASPPEWLRAYSEINDFEEQLTEHGIVLLKYWLHIDQDEQLRRFREREAIPWKRHKITAEDYRNREKWDAYSRAVDEMIERTSTEHAPWSLIEGNDKRYARIKGLRTYCERLERALDEA